MSKWKDHTKFTPLLFDHDEIWNTYLQLILLSEIRIIQLPPYSQCPHGNAVGFRVI